MACWRRRQRRARAWPCCRRTSPSWASRMPTSARWPRPTAAGRCRTSSPAAPGGSGCGSSAARCPCVPVPTGASQRPRWYSTPTASRVARYDKIHLFDVDLPERAETYRESATWRPGAQAQLVDTPARPARTVGVLRRALPGAVPALERAGRAAAGDPVRVHRAHRARALGDAAAGARHRESVLRDRAGAVGPAPERARDLRRQHDRGFLGPHPSACRAAAAAWWRPWTWPPRPPYASHSRH